MAISKEERQDYTGTELGISCLRHIGHTMFRKSRPGLGPHLHDKSYEICYLQEGRMHWWAGDPDNDYTVSAGELTLTYPDEIHGGVDNIHEACDLYWVSFELDPAALGIDADVAEEMESTLAALPRHFPADRQVRSYFEQMLHAVAEPGPFAALRIRSGLQQLLLSLIDYGQRREEPPQNLRMERVLSALRERMLELERVEDMACIAGLSPNRFINQFKAYTGYSPVDYLNREKLQRAKVLLSDPDRSITDIAFELNFSTTQYFATMFKKYTGMTPTQFRRESFR